MFIIHYYSVHRMHDRGEAWRCQNGLIFGHFKSEFHDKLFKSEFHDKLIESEFHDLFQRWPMDNVHRTLWLNVHTEIDEKVPILFIFTEWHVNYIMFVLFQVSGYWHWV